MSEYELIVPVPAIYFDEPDLWIEISAVGGGTLGKVYSYNTIGEAYAYNRWDYRVSIGSEVRDGKELVMRRTMLIQGDDLRAGATPTTHIDMARTLATFLSVDTAFDPDGTHSDRLSSFASELDEE